jgi:hypothetical protein
VREKIDVRDLYDEFLLCRALHHLWDTNPNFELNTSYNYILPLRCTRCTTERYDILNAVGDLITRYYRYPEKYRTGRVKVVQLRHQMIQRRLWIMRKGR